MELPRRFYSILIVRGEFYNSTNTKLSVEIYRNNIVCINCSNSIEMDIHARRIC